MKKSALLFTACLAVFAASCQKEEFAPQTNEGGKAGVTAVIETATKSAVSDAGVFTWSTGDEISVQYGDGKFYTFTNNDQPGKSAKFTLEGTAPEAEMGTLAYYPASESHTADAFSLVASYELNLTAPDTNAPMIGTYSEGKFTFKHLGGVMRFTIKDVPAGADKIVVSSETQDINGLYTVADGKIATLKSNGTKSTSFTFAALSGAKDITFYLPLPCISLNGIKIEVMAGDEPKASLTSAVVNVIEKGTLLLMPTLVVKGSNIEKVSDVGVEIESAEALEKVMESIKEDNPCVELTPDESVTEVTLSEAFTSDGTSQSELSLNYDEAPSELSIKEYTTGEPAVPAETSKGDVNVNIDGSIDGEVVVETPNMTTTFETTTSLAISKLTALTAKNTLVIGENVTVENLVIKGGNVVVNGKVSAWSSADGATGTITLGENAVVPTELPQGYDYDAESKESILRKVLLNGGSYTLTGDMKLASPLVVKATATLNLGGHKIIPAGTSLDAVEGTALTSSLVVIRRGAKLTVSGEGSIDTGNNESIYSAIVMTDTNDSGNSLAELVIDGSPEVKGYYYAIVGNGKRHNTKITIKDGTYSSYSKATSPSEAGLSLYHPQNGTLIVEGGKFSGFASAVEMRAGTLTISGGEFVSEASPEDKAANGSGSTMYGSAVAISQHDTDLNLNVNISGGIFTGVYALNEEDLENETGTENIKVSVTGGTFNGLVASENCSNFISGGTFTDPAALQYLAGNANITVDLKGQTFESENIEISGSNKNLTIKSTGSKGTINFGEEGNAAIALATKNSVLNIDNVILNVSKANKVLVCGSNETTTVGNTINITNTAINNTTVDGSGIQLKNNHILNLTGTDITHDYFGITQNGNYTGSKVTVSGGSISGKYTGIYLSNRENGVINTLNVDGATISSKEESAIEVKKTNITVTNSTLKSEATKQSYTFSAGGSGGVGYGIVLATYEEGRLYEGDVNEDIETSNTFELSASNPVNVYEYAGKPIETAEELAEYLTKLTDAGSGHAAINITRDITLKDGETWTPVKIEGYSGAGVITVNGNGHYIAGLSAPLFASGFAGNSGLIIRDLTIKDSKMAHTSGDQSMAGIFFGGCDSMEQIEFYNCHADNVTISGDDYVGGFIGWIGGYSKEGDGPVITDCIIKDCSVSNCTFTAGGSVGALIGHAGGNPNTNIDITDCEVSNCTFNQVESRIDKVGFAIGTVHEGQHTELTGVKVGDVQNTYALNGEDQGALTNMIGRFVPNSTGNLIIDGVEQVAFESESQK